VHAHAGTIELGKPALQAEGLLIHVRLPINLGRV